MIFLGVLAKKGQHFRYGQEVRIQPSFLRLVRLGIGADAELQRQLGTISIHTQYQQHQQQHGQMQQQMMQQQQQQLLKILKIHMPLFGKFSRPSQDLVESDYDMHESWDDRLNSPKNGMQNFRLRTPQKSRG